MNIFKKALLFGLIALAFASCEKGDDFSTESTRWSVPEVGELPAFDTAPSIIPTNDTIGSQPLSIIEALYPSAVGKVNTYASNFDEEGQLTAAIFNNDVPETQLFRVIYPEGNSGSGQNGSLATDNQFAVVKYGNNWELGIVNRGRSAAREVSTILRADFNQDSLHRVDARVQQYSSGIAIPDSYKPITLFSRRLEQLQQRDTNFVITFVRNPVKTVTFVCKGGDFDGSSFTQEVVFDLVQMIEAQGAITRDATGVGQNFFAEVDVEYDIDLGVYVSLTENADGEIVPMSQSDTSYLYSLNNATTSGASVSVVGFIPAPGNEFRFINQGIFTFNNGQLNKFTPIQKGLLLQTIRTEEKNANRFQTFVMPMGEQKVVGHLDKGSSLLPILILFFGGLVLLWISMRKRKFQFSFQLPKLVLVPRMALRPVLVTFAMLIFVGSSLQAQSSDCKLPSDWENLQWMQDVGQCPTCISTKVWLDNVERLYCLRLAQRELVNSQNLTVEQEAIISRLREEIRRLEDEIDDLRRQLMTPKATDVPKAQAPAVATATPDIYIDVKLLLADLARAEAKTDTILIAPEKEKNQRGYVGGGIGSSQTNFSWLVQNEPCFCPGAPISTGVNQADEGNSWMGVIGFDPIDQSGLSSTGQASYIAFGTDPAGFGDSTRTNLTQFRLALLGVLQVTDAISLHAGPQFAFSNLGDVNWLSLQGRVSVTVQPFEKWKVGVAANVDLASNSKINKVDAVDSHQWGGELFVQYGSYRLFGQYSEGYSNLGKGIANESRGGRFFKTLIGGLSINF